MSDLENAAAIRDLAPKPEAIAAAFASAKPC